MGNPSLATADRGWSSAACASRRRRPPTRPLTPVKETVTSVVRDLAATAARPHIAPDLGAIKQKQQATWASGDFALIGTTLQIVGESPAEVADVRAVERRHFNFRYRSAAHWLQIFRDYHGPTHKAFAALDPVRQEPFEADILALLDRLNVDGARSLVVPGEYLEVVVTKR